jgi:cytochrome c peroxidase
VGCGGPRARLTVEDVLAEEEPYAWRLPAGFPRPAVPDDNPMSEAKVELGRHLFYDRRLSGNGSFSCASCHLQSRAFTDGRARAVGSTGETHARNAMSLTNVAYNPALNWADPDIRTLEEQARNPMFNESPVELGLKGRERQALERLEADPAYPAMFAAAFPGEPSPLTLDNVVKAIAAFERTLISGGSPYDRLVYGGETSALSRVERKGMRLYFSERLRCGSCHGGLNLAGPVRFREVPDAAAEFHNNGLYDVDGRGGYPAVDRGLIDATGRRRHMGRFRAPTLRNIELTAPYMHDGSLATLEDVVDHYARGGKPSRHRDVLVEGFELDRDEKAALVAFLRSLTDRGFVTDERFSDPFAGELSSRRP